MSDCLPEKRAKRVILCNKCLPECRSKKTSEACEFFILQCLEYSSVALCLPECLPQETSEACELFIFLCLEHSNVALCLSRCLPERTSERCIFMFQLCVCMSAWKLACLMDNGVFCLICLRKENFALSVHLKVTPFFDACSTFNFNQSKCLFWTNHPFRRSCTHDVLLRKAIKALAPNQIDSFEIIFCWGRAKPSVNLVPTFFVRYVS